MGISAFISLLWLPNKKFQPQVLRGEQSTTKFGHFPTACFCLHGLNARIFHLPFCAKNRLDVVGQVFEWCHAADKFRSSKLHEKLYNKIPMHKNLLPVIGVSGPGIIFN
jgi:hypothetical protein